jgi:hypothetical protein
MPAQRPLYPDPSGDTGDLSGCPEQADTAQEGDHLVYLAFLRSSTQHPFRKSSRGLFVLETDYQLAYFYRNSQFPQEAQRLKDG